MDRLQNAFVRAVKRKKRVNSGDLRTCECVSLLMHTGGGGLACTHRTQYAQSIFSDQLRLQSKL